MATSGSVFAPVSRDGLSDKEVKAMQVMLDLPEDLARLLGENSAGLTRAALEALALEGLRASKLSVSQACRLLAIPSRFEEGFVAQRYGRGFFAIPISASASSRRSSPSWDSS
jgi:hypothetical protein